MRRDVERHIALCIKKIIALLDLKDVARIGFIKTGPRQRAIFNNSIVDVIRKTSLRFRDIQVEKDAVIHPAARFQTPQVVQNWFVHLLRAPHLKVQHGVQPEMKMLVVDLEEVGRCFVKMLQNRFLAAQVLRMRQAHFYLGKRRLAAVFPEIAQFFCKFRRSQPFIIVFKKKC